MKNDRRDAEHLVRLLLAGKLHAVRVPSPEKEALRDLVRARETLRLDLMRARHRLSNLLMRHGIVFDEGRMCTDGHRAWPKTVSLQWPAAQTTLLDLEGAIDFISVGWVGGGPGRAGTRDMRMSNPSRSATRSRSIT